MISRLALLWILAAGSAFAQSSGRRASTAERIRGLLLCIHQYKTAIANKTYPLLGKGELLLDEHRPLLERQLREWEGKLQALTVQAARWVPGESLGG